jgi:UDP:flavonoid glycosyltransferase YjiC (YdhE family)
MPRKTVLFMAEAVTLAHVARPYVLARGLDPEHYRIIFAADRRFDKLFDFAGMQREAMESVPSERFMRALAKGSPLYDKSTLKGYVEADLALLERTQPDLVVGDFRLSLSVSARLYSVPYATVSNIYWSPFAEQGYPVPDLPLTRVLGVSLAQRLFDIVRPMAFAQHTIPLNRVRREYGMASLGRDLHKTYTDADHVFYADTPDLFEHRTLPENHQFLGPLLWSADTPLPPWWDQIDPNRPIIFATMGSSGKKALLSGVIEALAPTDTQVLVAAAGASVPQRLPPNVWVADFLPAREVVARATLLVCNGGSPTSQLALAAGIPCIGIATNLDQFLNMSALERCGLGILLRADTFKPAQLRAAFDRIHHDSGFLRRIGKFRESIANRQADLVFNQFVAESTGG